MRCPGDAAATWARGGLAAVIREIGALPAASTRVWLGFLFCRCLWVCRAGSDGERQRGAGGGVWVLGARLASLSPPQHRCADTAPLLVLQPIGTSRAAAFGC